MRNAMPIQWIEQAEARQVLTAARFERAPTAPWSSTAGDVAAQIIPGLRSWLAARHPMGWAVPQVQLNVEPAVRLVAANRGRRDDEDFCTW